MSIDEQFANFEKLVRGLYDETHKLQSEIRSLKMGERIAYNLREAAKLTGLSYETLYNQCKAGRIPYSQEGKGGSMLIKRSDIERYLDEISGGPQTESDAPQSIPLHGAALKAVRGRGGL